MMEEKKAFVFDTNFIIQNQNLDEVLDRLKDDFSVYVTQVSIDERIAQNCRELKTKFEEAEKCKAKFMYFATISFKKTYEEECHYYQKGIQSKYEAYFGKQIIPFARDGEMLSAIIDRANKRIPPFCSAKEASDKGFKDCLLWLSMLAYFAGNGENEVVFVTDDKSAFRNNADFLQKEFFEKTGKTIEIHPNVYYKDLLKQTRDPMPEQLVQVEEIPDLETVREEIEQAVEALRGVEDADAWGNPEWVPTFSASAPFDKDYIKSFFEGLYTTIRENIFEKTVPATRILDFDGRIIDNTVEIPMKSIENVWRKHRTILKNYPEYEEQFYETAARILNRNYKPLQVAAFELVEDDELPF